MNKSMIAACCAFAVASPVFADASYQETTQISGGQFVDALRKLPQSLVPGSMKSLFDDKKTYYVVRFAEMREAIKSTPEKIVDRPEAHGNGRHR